MFSEYKITTDPKEMDMAVIHRFLAGSYWSEAIPLETLTKAINNSLNFGLLTNSGELIGFARMITDKATFAYLADVFILPAHRGKGLSKWLMENITNHPELQGLRRQMLATKDAHSLYQQFGFSAVAYPEMFMEKWDPQIYKRDAQ